MKNNEIEKPLITLANISIPLFSCAVAYIAGLGSGLIYRYSQYKLTEIITSDQIRTCEEKGGEYSISKWGGKYEESCRTKMREIEL